MFLRERNALGCVEGDGLFFCHSMNEPRCTVDVKFVAFPFDRNSLCLEPHLLTLSVKGDHCLLQEQYVPIGHLAVPSFSPDRGTLASLLLNSKEITLCKEPFHLIQILLLRFYHYILVRWPIYMSIPPEIFRFYHPICLLQPIGMSIPPEVHRFYHRIFLLEALLLSCIPIHCLLPQTHL